MRFISLISLPLAVILFMAPAAAEKHRQDRVVIVADQEAGAVRFVIDGREAVRLDAGGLHVRGDIHYGGSITDYGEAGFVVHIGNADAEADDEE